MSSDLDAIFEATRAYHEQRDAARQRRALNRQARGPPQAWADIFDLMQRYRKSKSSLDRWLRDPALNFPKPRLVRGKRLWSVADLAAFDERLLAQ